MSEREYIRIVVTHEPLPGEPRGEEAVYHVTSLKINEPVIIRSDSGGVVTIESPHRRGHE